MALILARAKCHMNLTELAELPERDDTQAGGHWESKPQRMEEGEVENKLLYLYGLVVKST